MTDQPLKLFDIQVDAKGCPQFVLVPQGSNSPTTICMSWEQLWFLERRAAILRKAMDEVPAA